MLGMIYYILVFTCKENLFIPHMVRFRIFVGIGNICLDVILIQLFGRVALRVLLNRAGQGRNDKSVRLGIWVRLCDIRRGRNEPSVLGRK